MSSAPPRPRGRSVFLPVIIAGIMVGSSLFAFGGWGSLPAGSPSHPASRPQVTDLSVTPVLMPTAHPTRLGPIAPPIIPHPVNGPPSTYIGQVINPNAGYTAEPAPMGLADLGVTSSGTAYTYGTSAFLGTMRFTHIDLTGESGSWTLQLNVVLRFTIGSTTYAYWIQDVAEPTDDSTSEITMSYIDNIWNFSGSFAMNSNTLAGNGTINSAGSGEDYYYVEASSSLPGSAEKISAPGQFSLLVRSYKSASGAPEVAFEYEDKATDYFVTYDNVVFTFATGVTQDNGFTVDGTQYTPGGSPLMYSAEMDIGGPGGGTAVTMSSPTDANITLFYFNGDNFESTPGAWNFGGDTAEAVSSAQSIWTWDNDGTLSTSQINGTTRDATPQISYSPDQVGQVYVTASCSVTDGYVASGATNWHFNGSWADLTLYPGTYPMWVNDSGGGTDSLGSVTVTAGGNQSESATSICSGAGTPSVTMPVPTPPTSVDVGQTVTYTTSASGGSGGYTYTWTPSSTSFGCAASTSSTLACTPTAAGSYTVTVYVTDSSSTTSSPQTSGAYTVYADPAVTAPVASTSYGRVGQSVTFSTTASGGDGTYTTYNWAQSSSGLGCSVSTSSSLTCTPSLGGNYTVKVSVTDGNSFTSPSVSSATFTVIGIAIPTASPATSEVGGTVDFTGAASGGSGVYTDFNWTESNVALGCTASTKAVLVCIPTAAGNYTVSVWVTDSLGETSTTATSALYAVSPGPSVTAPTPSLSEAEVSQSFSFSATASGGSGTGYVYTWTTSNSEIGCSSGKGDTIQCTPSGAATYLVYVSVKDSAGGVSPKESTSFTVALQPTAQLSASPSTITQGGETYLNVTVSGGIAPFTYSFSGLPSGCASSNTNSLACTPSTSGTFTVKVSVQDSDGQYGNSSVTLAVNAPAAAAAGGLSTLDLLILLIVAVIVLAIVGGVLRRRKLEPKPEPAWQGQPTPGNAPAWQETPPGAWPPPQGPGAPPQWGGPPPQ